MRAGTRAILGGVEWTMRMGGRPPAAHSAPDGLSELRLLGSQRMAMLEDPSDLCKGTQASWSRLSAAATRRCRPVVQVLD